MTTMRALTYDTFGGNENLHVTEQPKPTPGPGEVLIKVVAAGVNPVDWKVLRGHLQGLMPHQLPIIPGWDVAGVVEAVGPDAPEFAPGDEVMAYARKDWVHAGTYADYVTFSVRGVARKPAALTWAQAAGLPLAGGAAYRTLQLLDLEPGQTVLIHGASGGVGSLGVQVAVAQGVRVIGTASERNHDFLRSIGAEPVAYGPGLVDAVRALAPDGVDAVADFVGGVLDETLAVLAPGGRHASIAQPEVTRHGGLWVWVRPDAADLTALAELADAGRLTVEVAAVHDLADTAAAFAASEAGHTRGKIVIRVADGS